MKTSEQLAIILATVDACGLPDCAAQLRAALRDVYALEEFADRLAEDARETEQQTVAQLHRTAAILASRNVVTLRPAR